MEDIFLRSGLQRVGEWGAAGGRVAGKREGGWGWGASSKKAENKLKNPFFFPFLPGTCPEGYSPDEVMGLCYYVSTNAVTWLQARDQCLSNGTELAEPRDPFEELINDTLR